jgi:hypothetical protein
MIQRLSNDLNNKEQAISIEQAAVDLTVLTKGPLPPPSSRNKEGPAGRNKVMRGPLPPPSSRNKREQQEGTR